MQNLKGKTGRKTRDKNETGIRHRATGVREKETA